MRAEEFATLGKEVRAEDSATLGKKVRAEEYYIYTFDDDTDTGVSSCQLMQVPQYSIALSFGNTSTLRQVRICHGIS